MRRLLISVLMIASAIAGVAKEDAFAKVDIYQLIAHANQFTLYSLDHTDPESLPPEKKKPEVDRFHGYVVLGRIASDSPKTNEQIQKALTATFTDMYDGPPAMCFEPRIGVRLISGGKQLDILLCFQCLQSAFFLESSEMFGPLAPKAEAAFIALLEEHGVARDIPKEGKKRANQAAQTTPGLRPSVSDL